MPKYYVYNALIMHIIILNIGFIFEWKTETVLRFELFIEILKMCYLFFAELSEDKSLAIGQNPEDGTSIAAEDDQTTFDVKYLGNTPVDSAAGAIAEAVKTIFVMVSRRNQNFFPK